ncbi:MAG: cyclopropane fatty acyl phospholipid synthase [archaeon]
MVTNFCRQRIIKFLQGTGVTLVEGEKTLVNGNPKAKIIIKNPKIYKDIILKGELGVGEGYRNDWWETPDLIELFVTILRARLNKKVVNFAAFPHKLKAKFLNMQSVVRSKRVAKEHYDVGNKFYEKMLGKTMQYTCAFWDNAKTLDQAQINKMRLICEKAHLKPGDHVLELGGGWGMLAKFIAEEYDCHVDSYNISEEQVKYAQEQCKNLKKGKVNIICSDFRNAKGVYDKVISVGLCEHVGYKNYRTLMITAYNCLVEGGLFVMHTIGKNFSTIMTDRFFDKYIFPGGMIPSQHQLAAASEELFIIESLNNIGPDYAKTLEQWRKNFLKHWPEFKDKWDENHKIKYDNTFKRTWEYYLATCEAAFEARNLQLYQNVYVKDKGAKGKYKPVVKPFKG